MVNVDIRACDIGSDNDFELLLDWLELAAADTAAGDVVPSRTQWILNKQSKRQQRAQKIANKLSLPAAGSAGQ
jgi:hypothetical protein